MASEPSELSTDPRHDIHADGDVTFVVGEEHQRFRVSSAVMKNASNVFNAMLSPGFLEGETLLKSNQVSIPLPEDSHGMFAILCVLHGRNELVPQSITPKKVYHIAVLADKYDLISPMKFAIQHWLDLTGVTDDEGLWFLTVAAYLAQDKKVFSKVTRKLVIHHTPGQLSHFCSTRRA